MYKYILLANLEENFLKHTLTSLIDDGYTLLKDENSFLIMRKGDNTRNRESEEKMAAVMFAMMKRMRFDVSCCEDISNIFNRNYERLVSENFSGLKFNDRYIWELRQFLTAKKVNSKDGNS